MNEKEIKLIEAHDEGTRKDLDLDIAQKDLEHTNKELERKTKSLDGILFKTPSQRN